MLKRFPSSTGTQLVIIAADEAFFFSLK